MKKILMLTMSCNQEHFRKLLDTVRNTWAKPLMEGRYPEITWFAYTSCDDGHPEELVDWEDHMIYVNTPDDYQSTYVKTRRAYELIKDKVDFDWVVRTNTTVYVNIDNLLKRLGEIYDDRRIYSTYMINHSNEMNEDFITMVGFFYMMPKIYFDIGTTHEYDKVRIDTDMGCEWGTDDTVLSYKIHQVMNGYDIYRPYVKSGLTYMYKPCEFSDTNTIRELMYIVNFQIVYNPDIINDVIFVRVRNIKNGGSSDMDTRINGKEIEHLYEIDKECLHDR